MLKPELYHPMIVHFPIVLAFAGFAFFLLDRFRDDGRFRTAWVSCLTAGAVFAAIAVGTGLLAEKSAAHNDAAHEIIENWHEPYAFATLGLFVLLTVWGFATRWSRKGAAGAAFLAGFLGLIVCVTVTGHFGAQMVFQHGMGVNPARLAPSAHKHHEHSEGGEHGDEGQARGNEAAEENDAHEPDAKAREDGTSPQNEAPHAHDGEHRDQDREHETHPGHEHHEEEPHHDGGTQ